MSDRGDFKPVARALVVLAEDGLWARAGIYGRFHSGNRNGRVVFRGSFAYRIRWIRVVGSTIPGTKN